VCRTLTAVCKIVTLVRPLAHSQAGDAVNKNKRWFHGIRRAMARAFADVDSDKLMSDGATAVSMC
jgi:hypothetical protein